MLIKKLVKGLTFITIIGALIWVIPVYADREQSADIKLNSDEAEATLAILAKRAAGQPITADDWQRLFASEGYVRLKKRETAMGRAFPDDQFRTFVLSELPAERYQPLAETLTKWKAADFAAVADRIRPYLPAGTSIRATVYAVIKPRDNSFVFETKSDPAIFLYLDPAMSKEQFENTVAHELHHIGYANGCDSKAAAARVKDLSAPVQALYGWMGAFGEGFAMLAAAGGPDIHPHLHSRAADRQRWDRDMENFNNDLAALEKFFLDILADRLTKEERDRRGFAFFGVQGPWYTVGWQMAVMIEKSFGRAVLVDCLCDRSLLLTKYNEAAAKYNRTTQRPLALWSQQLLRAVNDARIGDGRQAFVFSIPNKL